MSEETTARISSKRLNGLLAELILRTPRTTSSRSRNHQENDVEVVPMSPLLLSSFRRHAFFVSEARLIRINVRRNGIDLT